MSIHDHPMLTAIRAAWPGARTTIHGGHALIDANDSELRAMEHASNMAGEFIDALKVTDMATWTEEQWHQFIAAICGGYVDSMQRQLDEAMSGMAKVRAT